MTLTREHIENIKRMTDGGEAPTLNELCSLALERLDMEPRPISEAPRDGREVVLIQNIFGAGDKPSFYMGSFGVARRQENGYAANDGKPSWIAYDLVHLAPTPTHFIPLSSLPVPKGE